MANSTPELIAEQFGSWLGFFTLIFTVFVVFVTITSWIHSVFAFPLLPYFENTLADFRHVTHLVLDNLFYRWFSTALEYVAYYGMVLLQPIMGWIPHWPEITVPSWVRDAAIISIVLLRSQKRAMKDSVPLSTLAMSDSERREWSDAIQSTSRPIKIFTAIAWKVVLMIYFITRIFNTPFKYLGLKKISDFVGLFVGGVLMLGLAYFAHDLAITQATKEVDSPYADAHRSFMKITGFILLMALLASFVFFVMNGYLVVDR